ncbi:MAG: DUF2304 domain-containing protein [Candidatus Auribacterota bacterium]|nr:DUF2304 domain-containing protein [Candidatus Auribacterota bacterium]
MDIKLIFFSTLGLSMLVVVIVLLRASKMEAKYSLLWLLIGISTFLTPLFYPTWSVWGGKLGLFDPNLVVLVLGIIGILLLCMQLSIALSLSFRERKTLAQQYALLNLRIEMLEETIAGKKTVNE